MSGTSPDGARTKRRARPAGLRHLRRQRAGPPTGGNRYHWQLGNLLQKLQHQLLEVARSVVHRRTRPRSRRRRKRGDIAMSRHVAPVTSAQGASPTFLREHLVRGFEPGARRHNGQRCSDRRRGLDVSSSFRHDGSSSRWRRSTALHPPTRSWPRTPASTAARARIRTPPRTR